MNHLHNHRNQALQKFRSCAAWTRANNLLSKCSYNMDYEPATKGSKSNSSEKKKKIKTLGNPRIQTQIQRRPNNEQRESEQQTLVGHVGTHSSSPLRPLFRPIPRPFSVPAFEIEREGEGEGEAINESFNSISFSTIEGEKERHIIRKLKRKIRLFFFWWIFFFFGSRNSISLMFSLNRKLLLLIASKL